MVNETSPKFYLPISRAGKYMYNTGQIKRRDIVRIIVIPATNFKRRRGRTETDEEVGI